jgi:peroxiredoxin
MLTLRQLIPPLTARGLNGQPVRAWDYKQKQKLLIAFLHGECAVCQALASRLASKSSDLLERETVALLISVNQPKWELNTSPSIVLASDTTGRAAQEYLGADALGTAGLSRVGVFVTDRYGELVAQWEAREADGFPPLPDIFKWLNYVQILC